MKKKSSMYVMAIFASVILFTQIIPVEAAGSEARKQAKEISKKIAIDKAAALAKLNSAKTAWENAKQASKTAKENYKSNPTEANKNAVIQANSAESIAHKNYKKLLSDFKKFKAKLSAPKSEKAVKNAFEIKKKEKSEERKKAEETSSKINSIILTAKQKITTTKSLWKSAQQATDDAKKTYKNDPTSANKAAIATAQISEDTARQNYKTAISEFKNLKFSLRNL